MQKIWWLEKCTRIISQYINADHFEEKTDDRLCDDIVVECDNTSVEIKDSCKKAHRTPRNINARLRFKIMKRDNFKCCACGASPAKDSSVELHVDHVIPWSKGGETVEENLQTLCSKCNLGKSDII